MELCYLDTDLDGYRGTDTELTDDIPCAAEGLAQEREPVDCDDDNAMRRPSLREICDGIDNDCNDTVDDIQAPFRFLPGQ